MSVTMEPESDVTVNNWLEGYRRMNWVNKQKIKDVLEGLNGKTE